MSILLAYAAHLRERKPQVQVRPWRSSRPDWIRSPQEGSRAGYSAVWARSPRPSDSYSWKDRTYSYYHYWEYGPRGFTIIYNIFQVWCYEMQMLCCNFHGAHHVIIMPAEHLQFIIMITPVELTAFMESWTQLVVFRCLEWAYCRYAK